MSLGPDLGPEPAVMPVAVETPSVARRVKILTRDSLVYGLGMAGQKFIGLLLLPVLTRVFAPAEYGANELVGLLVVMLSYFVVLGNDAALLRFTYDTDSEEERRRIATSALLFRVVAAGLVTAIAFPAARPISSLLFGGRDYSTVIRYAVLDLPFAAVVKFAIDLLRVRLRPERFVTYSIGNLAAIAVFTVVLTPSVLELELPFGARLALHGHGMGLAGVFVGRLVADVIFTAIGLGWIWKECGSPAPFRVLGGMLRYGLPLLPVGIAQFVLSYADRYALNEFVSLDQVGPYSVGARVSSFMMLFVAAFQYAWGPFAISIFREANARETYAKVFLLYAFVAGAIGLVITCLAREFLTLITTGHYVHGYRMAGFLVFAAVANGASVIPTTGLQIAKRTAWMGGAALIGAGLNIALNLLLARPFEVYGVATASLLSQIAATIFLFALAQRVYPIPFHPWRVLLTFLMAIGLAALGIFFGRGGAGAAALATVGALGLYLAGTLGLKVVSVQDFVILRNYLRKVRAR